MSKYIDNNRDLILELIIIARAIVYSFFQKYQLDNYGAITIAKVDRHENADQGNDLYIRVYYNGKIYDNVANSLCPSCIDKFFFVKIVKDRPPKDVIFYEDELVPD